VSTRSGSGMVAVLILGRGFSSAAIVGGGTLETGTPL
jgi:hypothetical protein